MRHNKDDDVITTVQSGGIFTAAIARKRDLSIGRLLKPNAKGKLICARSKREARFVFIRYVGDLRAEVSGPVFHYGA